MKKKLFTISLLIGLTTLSILGCSNTVNAEQDQIGINKLYNNDIYEFIDPDTGVHYLVYSRSAPSKGMGGITPRLNADGSIMVDSK